jgi:uncharacterized membrane protein YcaP (DUF421 family)
MVLVWCLGELNVQPIYTISISLTKSQYYICIFYGLETLVNALSHVKKINIIQSYVTLMKKCLSM